MQLKSIKLENIRSYLNQEIEFPDSSVLLSGDVGSGKSSILLAIEFALFGIRRKHLSGSSLLRNGMNEGSVELRFDIDGKDVVIRRTLKRGKEKVEQDSGYISVDGAKKDATAVELKTEILNLIGYPKELVTKTKNLVYRYTVYTPQEEMRQILTEKEELRLDTLRKVFGIDRYKRIRVNSQTFIMDLKDRRKEFQLKIEDLEEKKKQKQELQNKVKERDEKINSLLPELERLKGGIVQGREALEKSDAKRMQLVELKNELGVKGVESKNKSEQKERNKQEILLLEKQIEGLSQEIGKEKGDPKSIRIQIKEYEDKVVYLESRLKQANASLSESRARKQDAVKLKERILKLDKCPTCEQNVGREHKDSISIQMNDRVAKSDKIIDSCEEQIRVNENDLTKIKNVLQELKKEESSFSVINVKMDNLQEKKKAKDNLLAMQDRLDKEIHEIGVKKLGLENRLDGFKDIEQEHQKSRQELDKAINEEKELEVKKKGFETEKKNVKENIETLNEEIEAKLKIKERLNYLSQLQNWLEEYFIKIMSTMEKQVMLNVYSEFNDLFQNWFNVLMEDETINARLDQQFTPIIEQNGYETSIEYLSGGERTAAALAYRLALNKVINDLMVGIKTKDLIILDEPTDGFSSEQLDRIRDVLNEIGIKQIIIVSHENKIESFVDNVIRISKNEHVSEVA